MEHLAPRARVVGQPIECGDHDLGHDVAVVRQQRTDLSQRQAGVGRAVLPRQQLRREAGEGGVPQDITDRVAHRQMSRPSRLGLQRGATSDGAHGLSRSDAERT